ncbi:glycosyltransferase family 2 protein [Corallococcus sicarius]|uniref:Glycosyltransferase family 2 protein n=1 Tax=Corallococcus sicarius TaxID=2316726 RepID=A0A3A8NNF2_9BACT|nr:glycosyltransferase family 2 protein [Corallococcus sicarius]RKH45029.1 glycosyltransferase family 2 protein [Corallococcus sicarius]
MSNLDPMRPRVSVVIPAFNVEGYLGAAIDSVLAQTLADVEVVVVDDGSTDATVAVARGYGDARVRVFENVRNQGPARSRNVAIDQARGEWIAILDADDWWKEDRLERLLALAEAHGADIVCDDLLLVPEGAPGPESTLFTVHAQRLGRIDKPFEVDALKMAEDDFGILKPLFRREFLDERGLRYNPAFRAGEDFELLLRCLLASARMVVSHEAMYFYRARRGSLVASPVQCLSQILEMTDALIRDVDAKTHGEIVQALEGYRRRKRDELGDARFREPLHAGRWGECVSLAVKNPAMLLRYAAVLGERFLPLGLLLVLVT